MQFADYNEQRQQAMLEGVVTSWLASFAASPDDILIRDSPCVARRDRPRSGRKPPGRGESVSFTSKRIHRARAQHRTDSPSIRCHPGDVCTAYSAITVFGQTVR